MSFPSPYPKTLCEGKSWVSCAAYFRVSYTNYLVYKLFVGSNSSSIWRQMFVLWSLTYLKAPMEQFMRFLLPRLLSFWLQVCILNIHSVLPTICRELFTLVRHFLRLTSFGFFFIWWHVWLAINLKNRKISYLEITINLYLFISNTFGVGGGGGGLIEMEGYLRRAAYLI